MVRLFQRLFWFLTRLMLRLRYRVEVRGGEALAELRGPTIVMPNHPGYVDPPLVLSHIRLPDPLRPLVFTGTYRHPVLYPFMRMIGAVEVPKLSEHSRDAKEATLEMIERIAAAIQSGESILIYPSGRLSRRGPEVVGAARAAADLLQACPQANVVLVRTRGVWGSMFSFVRTGRIPNLGSCMVRSVLWGLASLVFFLPRRRVTMTVQVVPRGALPGPGREELNPFLEAWYNQGDPEPPRFVPYHWLFGPREFQFPPFLQSLEIEFDKIQPATREAVNEMVSEHLARPLTDDERRPDMTLDRLGMDSLERMDLALQIEQRFGFRSDRVADTLGELWALAEGLVTGHAAAEPAPAHWFRRPSDTGPATVLGPTLAEAFVRRALAHPNDVAAADPLSGVLTYRRVLMAAALMSRRLGPLEGGAVGVLLPASVAADLVFFALHLAGKLPVLLNWTTGPANLEHAVKTMQIRFVVTSRRFVDRLGIEIAGAQFVFLEDLRSQIGKWEGARTLLRTYWAPGSFQRQLPRQAADDPAVVLFTSGSEAAPKAVPLTHGNLMANLRSGAPALGLTRGDVILGFLPPFHSFGLTGNLVMPLVMGVRVVHFADPTDSAGLVRAIAGYRPTLLFTTPTFLGYMLSRASREDFASLRIIVTGAEKCPEAVREACRRTAPEAQILEGYGITECSPVVSVTRPGRFKADTVGPPLDGVDARIVDPDRHQPLPCGQTGLLLVSGPSIFAGYLSHTGPQPFLELDGRRWYNTGDLAALDEEGYIHFRGRLKRFLKAGGEMISLPALEEPLTQRYPPTEDGPQVAVEGVETPGGRRIVLFTTRDLPLKEANAILTAAGLRGVMRLDESRRIERIPILGTGKTDYKVLRKLVAESVEQVPG